MAFLDTLNSRNMWDDFGLVIQTGTAKFLELPERKEGVVNDWLENHGKERDLGFVRLKEHTVTLNCIMLADDDTDFWTKYNSLRSEIGKVNWQTLYIHDHGVTYNVAYQNTTNWEKRSKRLKNVPKVVVKFRLTLIVRPL